MGSEGEDEGSVDLEEDEEGSDPEAAPVGDGDADMEADSSGAEDMEDLAGDEARAGGLSSTLPTGVLATGVLATGIE